MRRKRIHGSRRARAAQLPGFDPPPDQLATIRKWRRERWEEAFLFQCRAHNLPPLAREHRFALAMGREWRFDFAFLPFFVAVEIEGIVVHGKGAGARFGMGRHHTVSGFLEDMKKYNAAQKFGWAVMRFDQGAVKSGEAITETIDVLRRKGWSGGSPWPGGGDNWPGSTVPEVTHGLSGLHPTNPAMVGCHRGTLLGLVHDVSHS